ncbi:hypothetical protein [Levilactobacillus suantsaii]|uniref:Uncharacterized protein n=1 Tax=Levilactobacillus suantsaii TaxID=2292255 RepID=A0A4Q0VH84_9LACO|nr:hypothetical protein [Levilactobacillus suantsaii]RXI77377.1 hypothetical protein DXH47_09305 [Levilactobacillus suantsaii]
MTEQMPAPKVDVTKLAEKDEHATIKYGPLDDKGNPTKSKEVTFRDPGYGVLMQIRSKQNVGDNERDFGEMANLINENVIVHPRYAFADLNKSVSKKDESKVVTLDGRKGKKVQILMKFPGYREAINLVTDIRGANGADMSLGVLNALDQDVFRHADKPDNPLDIQFWGDNGGGVQAISEALTYFTEVMDREGYLTIFGKAVTFLQPLY